MPGSSSRGIFLSYRRDDAGPYARLLKSELSARFPDASVFMDLDSIEPGLDFAAVIAEAVGSCAVLVALIGHQWATITDEGGRPRLEDPDDFVRFEVQAALERAVRVIPVLVDGARPLRQQQLPPELGKLARLNALELSLARYQYDADRLLDLIQHVLATAASHAGTGQPDGNTRDVAVRKGPEAVGGDPGRAARLFSAAERAARSITDEYAKAPALSDVAEALAATDPEHAERITRSITDEDWKALTLIDVVRALAATDPGHAERVAQSITIGSEKAMALTDVAEALAPPTPTQ